MLKKILPGDLIEVTTLDNKFSGKYFASPDKNHLVLKLNSGYNIGIKKSKIKGVKMIKKFNKKPVPKVKLETKKGLKTISILHTGGTISSAVDYSTGGVNPHFTPEELVAMFPEIKEIANIKSRLVRNMASDDMRFAHYNILAKEIEKEVKKGTNGIIITHGTDTMHFTASALSFILEDLPVPVILIGAQRSSDRGSSDAAMNFICAASFIAKTDFCDVAICMHKSENDNICVIIPGTKARKMHTSRRDAFKVVNGSNIAEISYPDCKVNFLGKHKKLEDRKLKLKLIKENLKIGLIKAHPQMFTEELNVYDKFNGLVLEGTGLGHFPINKIDEFTSEHSKIFNKIKTLAKKMPVVMSPQTIFGRLQMNVYSPGRLIQDIGVIGNYSDMTPETTFIKLAWLLSNHPKEVKEMMLENLRGELTKRLLE